MRLLLLLSLLLAFPATAQIRGDHYVNNLDVDGDATVQDMNNIRYADQFAGDPDAQIEACIADLPATGGTCDARGLEGAVALTGAIDIDDDDITLLLGTATISRSGNNQLLDITGDDVTVRGVGSSTIFDCSANLAQYCIKVGDGAASAPDRVTLSDFKVLGCRTAGCTTQTIRNEGYAADRIEDLTVERLWVDDSGGISIYLNHVERPRVRNNTVTNGLNSGVFCGEDWCQSSRIEGNYFDETPFDDSASNHAAIKVSGAAGGNTTFDALIANNTIIDSDDIGIACEGIGDDDSMTYGCKIIGNYVNNLGSTGDGGECIAVTSDQYLVANNVVNGCSATGILIYGCARGGVISGNVIDNVSLNAASFSHPGIQLYANTLQAGCGDITDPIIVGNTVLQSAAANCSVTPALQEPCTGNAIQLNAPGFCDGAGASSVATPCSADAQCDSGNDECIATSVAKAIIVGNSGATTNSGKSITEASGRCAVDRTVVCATTADCSSGDCEAAVGVATNTTYVAYGNSWDSTNDAFVDGLVFLGAGKAEDTGFAITRNTDDATDTPTFIWDESASGFAVSTPLVISADEADLGAVVGLIIDSDDDGSSNFTPFEVRDDSGGYTAAADLLSSIDYTGEIYARGGFEAEPSATPTLSLKDQDDADYSAGDPSAMAETGKVFANLTTVTAADRTGDMTFQVPIGDTMTTFMLMDGDNVDLLGATDSQLELGSGDDDIAVALPNGATAGTHYSDPSIAGQIAIDTTADQLAYFGTAKAVLSPLNEMCVVLEDPVDADDDIPFYFPHKAVTITDVYCLADGTTPSVVLTISDGSDALEAITCTDSGASDDGTISNGTFNALERMEFDLSTLSGTITWLTFCVTYTLDAE